MRVTQCEVCIDRTNENVPRGDHVPGGPNDGKGVGGREEHDDAPDATPPFAKGTDRGGDAGWDGSRAGGSTIDKR
jgi:hypothetical protein